MVIGGLTLTEDTVWMAICGLLLVVTFMSSGVDRPDIG